MQITSPGGWSNGSNISANGADASERVRSTSICNSPNNFGTLREEAVNLAFGVAIIREIRFYKKLALTFQIEMIDSGEGLQLRRYRSMRMM